MRGVRKVLLVVVLVVLLVLNSDKNFNNKTVGGVPVLSVNSMRTVRNKTKQKKTIREL